MFRPIPYLIPKPKAALPVPVRSGFTLTEILMVVAILAILAVLLAPTGKRLMRLVSEHRDLSQLRNIGMAHAQYMTDHRMEVAPGHNPSTSQFWFYNLLRPYLRLPLDNVTVGKVFISPLDPTKGGEATLGPIHRRSYAVNRRMLKKSGSPLRFPEIENPSQVFYLIHYEVSRRNTNWCEPNATMVQYVPDDWMPHGQVHLLLLDGHVEAVKKGDVVPGGKRFDLFGPEL